MLFGHYLVVGIAQLQGQLPAGHSLVVDGRPLFPHDGSHLYCLSRAIDAAVGEEVGMFVTILALIVTIAPIAVDRRTIVVVGCKSIDIGGALFVRLDQQLALLVAGFLVVAAGRVPPTAVVQSQASVRHGLPRPRIDHHIAHHVLRHGLRHDAQPRHKEQGALWGYHGQAVTLYQIDSGGESVELYGVFKHLPFRMLAKGDSALMTRQLRHVLSDSDIVFRVVGIQLGVAMQTGTIDAHRQRGDVAQVFQLEHLRCARHRHLLRDGNMKLWIGSHHPAVLALLADDGSLGQVAVEPHQRVQFLEAVCRAQC